MNGDICMFMDETIKYNNGIDLTQINLQIK